MWQVHPSAAKVFGRWQCMVWTLLSWRWMKWQQSATFRTTFLRCFSLVKSWIWFSRLFTACGQVFKLLHDLKKNSDQTWCRMDTFFLGHLRMYKTAGTDVPGLERAAEVAMGWQHLRCCHSGTECIMADDALKQFWWKKMREETPPWESRKSLHKTSKLCFFLCSQGTILDEAPWSFCRNATRVEARRNGSSHFLASFLHWEGAMKSLRISMLGCKFFLETARGWRQIYHDVMMQCISKHL